MHCHSDHYLIQLTATSSLINLVTDRQTLKIHPSVLVKVVEATLHAMERFPNTIQLQKCALAVLSNGRILLVCTSNILNFHLKFSERKQYTFFCINKILKRVKHIKLIAYSIKQSIFVHFRIPR